MITIFNRRELYLTNSLEQLTQIRNILEGNNIRYKAIIANSSGVPATYGAATYLNYIYVHKRDFEDAQMLVSSVLRH
jgi:hypothetical protein